MTNDDIKELKKALRKEIKDKKKSISSERMILASNEIFSRVEALPQFNQAKTVLAYWSLPDEVDTHEFVQRWAGKKRMILPIIVGDLLELREFNGLGGLVSTNSLGIQEPLAGELVTPNEIDFAIIPGLAFDNNGNRLGRGKGYYDKFLKQTMAYKVAVGFNFQIVDRVPVASFDVPVDIVITTKK